LGSSPSPEGQAQSLLSPDDSRYDDPANVLFIDTILGGMMPWVQAGVDLAAGRINESQFDQMRQEHQNRLDMLKQNNQSFVSAAEKAAPFLTGLGIGVLGGPSKVATTAKIGGAVGAAQGFGQGFSSGPVEEPSFSGKRVGEGLGTAAITGPMGAAGAAVPAGVAKVKGGLQKRADDKKAAEADKVTAAKKYNAKQKAARTRKHKGFEARYNKDMADKFEEYTTAPADAPSSWKESRKIFMDQTSSQFADAATKGKTVTDLARATNLPEIVVAERIKASKPNVSGAGVKLMDEVDSILASKEAYRARLGGTDKPKPRAKKAK
jgi:hypothetical protein